MTAIAMGGDFVEQLARSPELAAAALAKGPKGAPPPEFFLEACGTQGYVGATALHVAAAAYDHEAVRHLVAAGADVAAGDRRGARPLHAAVRGGPGAVAWD